MPFILHSPTHHRSLAFYARLVHSRAPPYFLFKAGVVFVSPRNFAPVVRPAPTPLAFALVPCAEEYEERKHNEVKMWIHHACAAASQPHEEGVKDCGDAYLTHTQRFEKRTPRVRLCFIRGVNLLHRLFSSTCVLGDEYISCFDTAHRRTTRSVSHTHPRRLPPAPISTPRCCPPWTCLILWR